MKDMNATPESKQKMMEALKRIHFDDEGRTVFEDEYMQDLDGEDEEPSGSGKDILSQILPVPLFHFKYYHPFVPGFTKFSTPRLSAYSRISV
jgi:hypothetical protein